MSFFVIRVAGGRRVINILEEREIKFYISKINKNSAIEVRPSLEYLIFGKGDFFHLIFNFLKLYSLIRVQ